MRNEIKKEIEAIIHAGCMIVVKQIYDEFANLPKKELNLKKRIKELNKINISIYQ